MEQYSFGIIYPQVEDAWTAVDLFRKLQQAGKLELKRAGVVVRQANGQLTSEEVHNLNLFNLRYGAAGLAGTMVGLIGAAPLGPAALVMAPLMGAVGTAAAMGGDLVPREARGDSLYRKVSISLPVGSAAALVDVKLLDLPVCLRGLARLSRQGLKGQLVHQSLPTRLATGIEEALAGEAPAIVAQNEEPKANRPISRQTARPERAGAMTKIQLGGKKGQD